MTICDVRRALRALADPKLAAFNEKLTPGVTGMLGIKVPDMRKIAKRVAAEGLDEYAPGETFEEVMIEGMAIGYAKLTLDEYKARLEQFVPKIDNWATCDCCTATYTFMQKNRSAVWPWLMGFVDAARPYATRFALVALLDHFVVQEYIDRVLDVAGSIRSDHYYVQMANAWLLSLCYVRFPEKTEAFLANDRLDDFTHNKAIQKIRESHRVSEADKARLIALKRKDNKTR